ncbi:Putative cryptic loci regulator 2 [Septoria linicola]|uniref:Cryptic loci regulator 2 n=1 Tax=Septoria linicola TaxID=215465 RepID=A0A9Q9EG25_9PEZI|nr:putative cryptic loci regulator 2 [Septoria linicola]USW49560.1 Putative cryptic loci regulator 2 [Septoria linicola]
MARNVVSIAVWNDSDGTNAPAKDASRTRNDGYFEERLADLWMKDRGQHQPGVTYKLNRLPTGYTGWEKRRGDSKHIDRYMSGHPSGKDFRSLNEAWPHFQSLINGGAVGCQCVLCTGGRRKSKSEPSNSSGSPSVKSRSFGASAPVKGAKALAAPKPIMRKTQQTFDSESDTPKRGKQADEEGIPDYYRILLDKVKEAGPTGNVRENIVDQLSPDWRASHQLLQRTLNQWQQQPAFVPRVGELVLFVRTMESDNRIAWHSESKSLRLWTSQGWRDTRWEAGVVTQLPTEAVDLEDLLDIPASRTQNVTYSGFRVEPLSEPNNDSKPFTSQHKYVALHALRSFALWRACLGESDSRLWHPTVKHALSVTSSWSLLGKYSFVGTWPEATLFCRGLYLGSELIMMGDLVRLEPRPGDPRQDSVFDVMAVSSIRLRFVKLDEASDDDYDNGQPYTTCLHVAGRVFSLDPKRSYGNIGASPARPGQCDIPQSLAEYGNWFNVTDPNNERQRLEVPYTRVLGRCVSKTALERWLASPNDQGLARKPIDISQGLSAMREARAYSRQHDSRIDRAAGQSWFWAEHRIEQLDLHEINGRFVGPKDETRDKKQVAAWRQALRVLDGKKGSLDEYFAAKRQREEQQKQELAASSGYGMMTSAAQAGSSPTDDEPLDNDAQLSEAMDVDEGAPVSHGSPIRVGSLDGNEEEDDDEEDEIMVLD